MHIRRFIILFSALAPLAAFAAGCAHEEPVPTAAAVVGSGPGQLSFTAYSDGKVYLYDLADKKKIFTAGVLRGDVYLADPTQDRIEVSGKPLEHSKHLTGDHSYTIYFLRTD